MYFYIGFFLYICFMNEFKIGDKVKWLDNSYTIVDVTSRGVILKQNFSIGTVLNNPIKIEEIEKI